MLALRRGDGKTDTLLETSRSVVVLVLKVVEQQKVGLMLVEDTDGLEGYRETGTTLGVLEMIHRKTLRFQSMIMLMMRGISE